MEWGLRGRVAGAERRRVARGRGLEVQAGESPRGCCQGLRVDGAVGQRQGVGEGGDGRRQDGVRAQACEGGETTREDEEGKTDGDGEEGGEADGAEEGGSGVSTRSSDDGL